VPTVSSGGETSRNLCFVLIEKATLSSESPAGVPRFSFGRYVRSLHYVMVSILVFVFVAFVAIGWALRPPASGFPSVPNTLYLQVLAPGVHTLTEQLVQRADGSVQLIVQSDQNPQGPTLLGIYNPAGARVCTPKHLYRFTSSGILRMPAFKVTEERASQSNPNAPVGPVAETIVNSVGPGVYVDICYPRTPPVRFVGAYLSAQFPKVQLLSGRLQNLRSKLTVKGANTADFSIQSPLSPSSTDVASWTWSQAGGLAIHFSAIDASTSQYENHQAFLSGIALGIAGGALITILQELVVPFSRRKDKRLGD